MQAIRIHQFGGIDALVAEDVPRPVPGPGELLLGVKAAGVGPWDALIRSGGSVLPQPLPLTLGSDVAGIVVEAGAGAAGFAPGDAVFGATNPRFIGGYAEYAAVSAAMVAPMPRRASFVDAAAAPVVACTAWQMVFEHGAVDASSRVLILGGGGSVGACAVQLAGRVARDVIATASPADAEHVRALGAHRIIDARTERLEDALTAVDVVLDTVGGELQARSFAVLRRGGVLVSAVSEPDRARADSLGVRAFFFLVEVTSGRLAAIAARMDAGELQVRVGEVLPLAAAARAHEMLAGAPHAPGKIVLAVDPSPANL